MMKTSLYIEPRIDAALARKAEAQGISKAELIRRQLAKTAEDAPRPRMTRAGTIPGPVPPDLATDMDKYLDGLGED